MLKVTTSFLLFCLWLVFLATSCQRSRHTRDARNTTIQQPCAQTRPDEDCLSALLCASDFSMLMGAPLSSQFSKVDAVKVIYDIKTDSLYFINNEKYRFHYDFCSRYLTYSGSLGQFNVVEYGHKDERRFLLANLNLKRIAWVCLVINEMYLIVNQLNNVVSIAEIIQ